MHDVDYLEALLQHEAVGDRVLDRDLDLDPTGVRLCPNETGIDNPDPVQPPQLLETQSQELSRLGGGDHPAGRREKPSVAVSAEVYNSLAFDALRDVVLFLDAVVAERTGGCLAVDRSAAFAAENTEPPRSQTRTVAM